MKLHYLLTLTFVCMVGLAACGGSEPPEVADPVPEPPAETEAPAAPAEQFVAGQLQTVDADAMTVVLKDTQGAEQTFAFSPTTSVTGIINAGDLAQQEGRNATIRYIEQGDLKSALQIHIEAGS